MAKFALVFLFVTMFAALAIAAPVDEPTVEVTEVKNEGAEVVEPEAKKEVAADEKPAEKTDETTVVPDKKDSSSSESEEKKKTDA